MTLKKKDKIKSANNKESPEYCKKALSKKVTTVKWVENKTYSEKTPTKKNEEKKKEIPIKKKLERR